jgi:hypothetical protein
MTDLEQEKLKAEISNLNTQAEKANIELANLKKTFYHRSLEIFKIFFSFVLGIGGITAVITGFQLSEIKKERMELEVNKAKEALVDLNIQKDITDSAINVAKSQLAFIKTEMDTLHNNLETANMSKSTNTGAFNKAIDRVTDIGNTITKTNQQLQIINHPLLPNKHNISDYLVGIQTIGFEDTVRVRLNEQLHKAGYSLHELSFSYQLNDRPVWFAKHPTILYYARSSFQTANDLAELMKKLTSRRFIIQQGAGLGVDPSQKDITLFVHYPKD